MFIDGGVSQIHGGLLCFDHCPLAGAVALGLRAVCSGPLDAGNPAQEALFAAEPAPEKSEWYWPSPPPLARPALASASRFSSRRALLHVWLLAKRLFAWNSG